MMTKTLIAGLATIVVAGTALVGTGMYATNTAATGTTANNNSHMSHMRQSMNPQGFTSTLSGKVSPEALTALTALTTKHKAEMDVIKSNGSTPDKTTMDTQHATFKTEMDALMVKYPELKTALPQQGMMGKKMDRGNNEMDTLLATLPTTAQAEIKSIHESYRTKQDALRTEEKTKIDSILANYPEIKAKLDTLEASRPQDGRNDKKDGRHNRQQNQTDTSTTSAQ